ncbi:hypothetical protein MLD38_014518 [Melastoma candidum]|uniref:Uncharacterized protein n=1 Tax=Melastoma candidum TaxID=119954 RepID=A0ACB9RCY4_9MYRT|nr:hypothetical protein MLD38_014518 [Melastoma candidum]
MSPFGHFLRRRSLHFRRCSLFATLGQSFSLLPLSFPTFQIWASNTSLDKTLVSAGLAFASLSCSPSPSRFLYLKPVQTGFPTDSDSLFPLPQALLPLLLVSPLPSPLLLSHQLLNSSLLPGARSLFQTMRKAWRLMLPGSCVPDLAAKREGGRVDDAEVLRMLIKSFVEPVRGQGRGYVGLLCGGDCWRRGQSRAFLDAGGATCTGRWDYLLFWLGMVSLAAYPGPDATMQTEFSRDIGYAAARYGHVMFPENIYQPALECAELLLSGVGKGWASRVYFSDNGSTATEIALKMAFRKFCVDHAKLLDAAEHQIELLVLALHGSYHGDTLGAMEAQSPSAYTSFLQQPWYSGRGLFLHPPTIALCDELWEHSVPEELLCGSSVLKSLSFDSREDIFLHSRDASDLARLYSSYISKHLSASRKTAHVGPLIIEPAALVKGGLQHLQLADRG